ncbi:MAG: hypothetical protein HFI17_15015 [Lachnospiraceae bacterium]|jgi:hypothetical protein|nr:hypothetical protein [Lachnospiraceae bacterium]
MIPEYLKKNLDLFRAGEYSLVLNKGETVFIEEDAEEGRAGLEGFFANDAIVFHFPEKRTLPYLDARKKACQCADKFLFIKNDSDETWKLHILEFKKSIKYDKWKKARNQFKFGIMNARALAAFLKIEIDEIILETAYRNNWMPRSGLKSPTEMRAANSTSELKAYREWAGDFVTLEVDAKIQRFPHFKIQLDEAGNGKKVFV